MPRGQCPRRGPIGNVDLAGLRKALNVHVEVNMDPDDRDDGCLLNVFDLGEYMQRTGPASNRNPPKLRTLFKNGDVLKLIARFSAKGDGNVKHDELRSCFAAVLSGRNSNA